MSGGLAGRVGGALFWRGAQLGLARLISLAGTLVLARLLAPAEFGVLAIALAALTTLQGATDLGLIPALVHSRDATPRQHDAAWSAGLLRALAVGAVLLAAAPAIAGAFGEPRATPVLRALAARPLLEAAASIGVAGLTRSLRFRPLALIGLSAAAAEAGVAIALAPRLGVWALVAGALAGPAVAAAVSYGAAPHRPRFVLDKAALGPLARFGRWVFAGGLVGVVGSALLQLVISRRLGTAELGLYVMARKLTAIPGELALQVVGGVAFPLYASRQAAPQLGARIFRAMLSGMAALLVPVYVIAILLAPSLVRELLGPRWAGAELVVQILAVGGLIGLLGDAVVPVLRGTGRPAGIALLEVVQVALLVSLAWILAGRFGVPGAAAAWLPAVAASQVLAGYLLLRALPRPFAGLGRPLAAVAASAAAGGALGWMADAALGGPAGLAAALAVAAAATGLLLCSFDRRYGLGLAEQLQAVFPGLTAWAPRLARSREPLSPPAPPATLETPR